MSENNLVPMEEQKPVIPGFNNLQSFELAQRAASLLAKSSLVPKEYQGNVPNCVIALNMAERMGADPFMVMQNLYIVYGKPGWSSKFLISLFNVSGKFSALRYEWIGKQGTDEFGCRAWAIERSTGEKLEGSVVTIAMAKKEGWYGKTGSKWQTMPQQMLMYRAASFFIGTYAPELGMGMYTDDEIIDIGPDQAKDTTPEKTKANTEFLDIPKNDKEPDLQLELDNEEDPF